MVRKEPSRNEREPTLAKLIAAPKARPSKPLPHSIATQTPSSIVAMLPLIIAAAVLAVLAVVLVKLLSKAPADAVPQVGAKEWPMMCICCWIVLLRVDRHSRYQPANLFAMQCIRRWSRWPRNRGGLTACRRGCGDDAPVGGRAAAVRTRWRRTPAPVLVPAVKAGEAGRKRKRSKRDSPPAKEM